MIMEANESGLGETDRQSGRFRAIPACKKKKTMDADNAMQTNRRTCTQTMPETTNMMLFYLFKT